VHCDGSCRGGAATALGAAEKPFSAATSSGRRLWSGMRLARKREWGYVNLSITIPGTGAGEWVGLLALGRTHYSVGYSSLCGEASCCRQSSRTSATAAWATAAAFAART
jgi:hypothetical protein